MFVKSCSSCKNDLHKIFPVVNGFLDTSNRSCLLDLSGCANQVLVDKSPSDHVPRLGGHYVGGVPVPGVVPPRVLVDVAVQVFRRGLVVYRRIKMRDHHSEKQGIGHLT